jgi:hypothetical protein
VGTSAAIGSNGRFAIRLRCRRGAPAPCGGKVVVSRGGKRLDAARFRINRRSTADVWLALGRGDRRSGPARVLVVPSDRSVVRKRSSARVMLTWKPRRSVSARLTRAEARRLVAKHRVIADSWNR